jgi:type IV pilus assembly protein PilY1
MLNKTFWQLMALFALAFSAQAFATQSDDFTQAVDGSPLTQPEQPNSWIAIGYACMTAGSNTVASTSANYNNYKASDATPRIPGCNYPASGATYPAENMDAAGSGALRLTPGDPSNGDSQHGAIVSTTPFASNAGLQVTFTTYTYGGDGGGSGGLGADGISFFLIDPSQYSNIPTTTLNSTNNLGSWGGSLAYTCSNANPPYTGLTGGYLGLGMDEYGNFLNGGSSNDNTATGVAATGGNSWGSGNYQSNRIGLRGPGNVSWAWLNYNYPAYYPSSLSSSAQQTAVQATCKSGTLHDYSAATSQTITSATLPAGGGSTMTLTTADSGGFSTGDTVNISSTITTSGAVQSIVGNPTVSGSNMTITVPGTYTNNESITIGGILNATYPSQSISGTPTVSGTTMTVTVPSVTGYASGKQVILAGLTAGTTQNISNATISGNTMTLTVPSTAGYVAGTTSVTIGGTITASTSQSITSASVSGTTMTVGVGNVSNYSNGESVTIAGLTASNTQNISSASVSGSTMTVNVPSTTGFTANSSITISGLTANTQQSISAASVSGSNLAVNVGNGAGFAANEPVTLSGVTLGNTQTISSASVSGSTLTVNVPSTSGFTVGHSVTLAGITTFTSQSISSATVSGTTMTVTVPNIAGFASGESITIGGGISATGVTPAAATFTASNLTVNTVAGSAPSNQVAAPQTDTTTTSSHFREGLYVSATNPDLSTTTITPAPSTCFQLSASLTSNTVWLCHNKPASSSSALGGTLTAVSSATDSNGVTWYLVSNVSGNTNCYSNSAAFGIGSTSVGACGPVSYTLTVNASNTFKTGDSVTLSGLTPSGLNTSYTISSASGSSFTVPLSSNPGTPTCSSCKATDNTAGTAPTVTGPYTINSISGSTFNVTLSSAAGSIVNASSGTVVATTAPVVNGPQTIATVGTGTFTVTLNEPVLSISTSSPSAAYGSAPTAGSTIASISGNTLNITLSGPAYSVTTSSPTVAATTAPTVTGSQTMASVGSGSFTVTLTEPANSITNSSGTVAYGTAPSASGTFTINSGSINTGAKTFQVTLSSSAYSVTNSSGTVSTSAVTISGNSYTVASVLNSTQFTVTLSGNPISITDTSGTVSTGTFVVDNTYTIGTVNTGAKTFTVTLPSSANSITTSSATAQLANASLDGSYTINDTPSTSSGNSTFTVPVSPSPSSVANTSGTVSTAGVSINGNYTISSVTSYPSTSTLTFTIPVTSSSGSTVSMGAGPNNVTDNSNNSGGRDLGIAVLDYQALSTGYAVLDSNHKIANQQSNSSATRAAAIPITYKLQITPNGLLNFFYNYNNTGYTTVTSGWNIQTFGGTNPSGTLPSSFLFGFAASTGGSRNYHDITCFVAEPMESSSSATANTVEAGQIKTNTRIYLASYNPTTVSGSLVADSFNVDSSGNVTVYQYSDWDMSCTLTGVTSTTVCSTTNVAGPLTAEPSAYSAPTTYTNSPDTNSRQLLTWNGSQGVPLEWANLTTIATTGQQAILNSTDSYGQIRLNWLRGDRSEEQTVSCGTTNTSTTAPCPGPLRVRASVLADIIDSSPLWVGAPSANIRATFADSLYGSAVSPPETSYTTYKNTYATRLNVVYVGANDGLLHAARSGSFASDGVTFNSAYDDGYEVLGFMPSTVLANSNVVTLTNPAYSHNYFVDASPGSGDLFYGNAWHTWLVSSLGAGGSEVFALDITDPSGVVSSSTAFSEANASALVKGDWTSSSITCQTVAGVAVSNCGNNLGQIYGTPIIRRLHNGQWAMIFGNGRSSANYHGGIYIGLIDKSTGAVTFYWLDTGKGSSGSPNGIDYVAAADLDGDSISDYLYAGDLLGNVWRVDVTSTNIADWQFSTYGQPSGTPAPLFSAKSSSGTAQPITTKILVTTTYTGGQQRVLLGFGTGEETPATSLTSSPTYATQTTAGAQSMYGIWDWDMYAWDTGTTTSNGHVVIPGASTAQYAYLAEVSSSPYRTFTRAGGSGVGNLLQDQSSESGSYRMMAQNDVCWQPLPSVTGVCPTSNNSSTSNTEYGWYYDFPDTGEQIIYNPVFVGGTLFVNTTTPPTSVSGCKASLPGGWTMGFNMASGGGFPENLFPDASGSLVPTGNSIVGSNMSGVGSPYFFSVGSQLWMVSSTSSGTPTSPTKPNPQGGVSIRRMSWEEIR